MKNATVKLPENRLLRRFNNSEFRSVVEETVEQLRPANVFSSSYWLNPQEMEQFEQVYYEWRIEKAKDAEDQVDLDLLNMRVIAHLLKYMLKEQKEEPIIDE